MWRNTGEKKGILGHTGCARSLVLLDLWTNWTIPLYLLQEPSAQLSGEKVLDVPGVFIRKECLPFLLFFLMGTRVFRMEEGAIIAVLPNGPIRAPIKWESFLLYIQHLADIREDTNFMLYFCAHQRDLIMCLTPLFSEVGWLARREMVLGFVQSVHAQKRRQTLRVVPAIRAYVVVLEARCNYCRKES